MTLECKSTYDFRRMVDKEKGDTISVPPLPSPGD